MTEPIEDWLERLVDPSAYKTEKERAVMKAVRSGLRAAEPVVQIDQVALQRLHKRLADQGLYDAPVARSRRMKLFGYAAALILGVSIILNYAVMDKPLHEAALQISTDSASKRESYSQERQAAKDERLADEREVARFSDSSIAAEMTAPAKQKMSASSAPERVYGGNDSEAGRPAPKPESPKLNSPIEMRLTTKQWQALYELNKQGLSLVKSEIEDIWILTLSNEASKVRWIDALPKSYKNESWTINTDIEIQLVIAHD